MKNLLPKLALAAALLTLAGITDSRAANLTLDGSGFYKVNARESYRDRGARQTGRYRNLGEDYYHRAKIGMDWITNNSNRRSGSLSFELWAMNYYQSTGGIILMTRGLKQLRGGYYYESKVKRGHAVSLDRRRFPELSLWEFTKKGWKWRDSLVFDRKGRL